MDTAWTPDELDRIGTAEELLVASYRADGTLRPFVTIWVVRAGDDVFIRSAYGSDNPWFRRARSAGTGRIRAGGVEQDVAFLDPGVGVHPAVDAAYQEKYGRYAKGIVNTVVGPRLVGSTFLLRPLRG